MHTSNRSPLRIPRNVALHEAFRQTLTLELARAESARKRTANVRLGLNFDDERAF